jgi:hypothetical protein
MILAKFDLLQHVCDNIREQKWARPAVREATAKFFKLCHAKEELLRLNIEIHRLRAVIHDEEAQISAVISELTETNQHLAIELRHLHRSQSAVNRLHLHRLDHIQKKFGVVGLHLSEGSSSGQCDETEEGPAFYATGDDKENLPPETHNDVAATVLHDDWPLTGAVFPSKLLCF